ncbi:MAG TPA: phosphotransferase [Kineosporiaceae bacterium]
MTTPARGVPARPAALARRAALDAAAAAGLDVREPRLLRHGSHAVFTLGAVVARVTALSPRAVADARQSLLVARWLAATEFPAGRAVADDDLAVPQPVTAGEHLVTFWHSLGQNPAHGSTADLGRLLRRFHALEAPPDMPLVPMDPVGRITRQLAGARVLQDGDRAWLTDRLAVAAAGYAGLDLTLPPGHLHGDATVANVVLDGGGVPTLIDLDLLRTGPREWDLLRTAVYARRLGWHTQDEYREFSVAYGVDVTAHPGFDVLADLCELLQVAWLAEAATGRPELAAELLVRIGTLRAGTNRCVWCRI